MIIAPNCGMLKRPAELLEKLRASGPGPPWKCKLQLRHGRTVIAVEINADGEITNIGGRAITPPATSASGRE